MNKEGYLWRKYVCPCPVDRKKGPSLIRGEVGKRYPHLTRWDLLQEAEIGFVRMHPDGGPQAVCYDLQKAFREFYKILGHTGSTVVDLMEFVETFENLIMNAFMGVDTPFFWSRSGHWRLEMADFCHEL